MIKEVTLEVGEAAGAGNWRSLQAGCVDFPAANHSAPDAVTPRRQRPPPSIAFPVDHLNHRPTQPGQLLFDNPTQQCQFIMASLRTHSAARLLRGASSRGPQMLAARRYEATIHGPGLTPSASQANKPANTPAPLEPSQGAIGQNQPDYGAHIDKATSYDPPLTSKKTLRLSLTCLSSTNSTYTPVPKRVLDGSEPGVNLPAAVLSGAPVELQARTVRIYKPAKPATQSGDWKSKKWRMDWDVLPKGHRWENELIGWQSSGDFMQGTNLSFKTKEDAVAFAEKQGYEYFVQEPNERKFVPKAYANNFLYSPGKLKHIRTK